METEEFLLETVFETGPAALVRSQPETETQNPTVFWNGTQTITDPETGAVYETTVTVVARRVN